MWVVLGESSGSLFESNKSCPCRALGEKYLRWAWGSVCDGCWTRRCPRRGRTHLHLSPRSFPLPHWGPWHQAPCLPTLALISGRSRPQVQGSPCLSSFFCFSTYILTLAAQNNSGVPPPVSTLCTVVSLWVPSLTSSLHTVLVYFAAFLPCLRLLQPLSVLVISLSLVLALTSLSSFTYFCLNISVLINKQSTPPLSFTLDSPVPDFS